MHSSLARRHVVLLGVGHTNAHIVRRWAMRAPSDTDLTCITDHFIATYSGMLPGVLARQFSSAEMEIDLVRLCAAATARVVKSQVCGLDLQHRKLLLVDRPPMRFDVLSIGIGSVPSFQGVRVESQRVVAIKPMQSFLMRLRTALNRAQIDSRRIVLTIVGSGVAGVEIASCLPPFLREMQIEDYQIEIVTRSQQVVPEASPAARRLIQQHLSRAGVEVSTEQAVIAVKDQHIELDDGTRRHSDVVIWATGATAPPLLRQLSLPVDERGFLLTDRTLQVLGTDGVFAVGDSGTIQSENLSKAGVYAVRQGKVLWENLIRALDRRPLVAYRPQRDFLKLINTGDGKAIGHWRGLAARGAWLKKLKDRIDVRFVQKYHPEPMQSIDQAMQCRGCGCKLGADSLSAALAAGSSAELRIEDASQLPARPGLLASTDFFSCPLDDAYLNGRLAALHSASDLIACGASPQAALANIVVPEGHPAAQRDWLTDFLVGARLEFGAMGAEVIGGHTIVGPRAEAGFAVVGESYGPLPLRKGGLTFGDELLLTKPLGSGILLAAVMRGICPASDYELLLEHLLARQFGFVEIAAAMGLQAATDVTGFGLAGHLLEMLQASQCGAIVQLSLVPMLPGAIALSAGGLSSSLYAENVRAAARIDVAEHAAADSRFKLLFDPQTCGGLLIGVSQDRVDELCERFEQHDLQPPVKIGRVIPIAKDSAKPLLIDS